jgi:lipopolysaccharide/colanic/teichoic acid biosynthesis glycosyltransferase
METKLAYDLWYLRHRRLIVDVMICLQTLPRLFAQAGR